MIAWRVLKIIMLVLLIFSPAFNYWDSCFNYIFYIIYTTDILYNMYIIKNLDSDTIPLKRHELIK